MAVDVLILTDYSPEQGNPIRIDRDELTLALAPSGWRNDRSGQHFEMTYAIRWREILEHRSSRGAHLQLARVGQFGAAAWLLFRCC